MSQSPKKQSKRQRPLTLSGEKRERRRQRFENWNKKREEALKTVYGSGSTEHKNPPLDKDKYTVTNDNVWKGIASNLSIITKSDNDINSTGDFFVEVRGTIYDYLKDQIEKNKQIKFKIILIVELVKKNDNGKNIQVDQNVHLSSFTIPVYEMHEINTDIDSAYTQIDEALDVWNANGSNWTIQRIIRCDIHSDKWAGVRIGRCDRGAKAYFPLPKWLANKKACVNIQNEDDYCFKYCMEAGYNLPTFSPERVRHYLNRETFIYKTAPSSPTDESYMSFPFNGRSKAMKEFERLNKHLDISVSCFYATKKCKRSEDITVLYKSNATIGPNTKKIDLLMVENEDGALHWVLVNNFSRLFNLGKNQQDICRGCLIRVPKSKLADHELHCSNHQECKARHPSTEQAYAGFKNYRKRLEVPFVIYADFECISETRKQTSLADNHSVLRTHVPNAYAYVRICNYDDSKSGNLELYRTKKERITYDKNGVVCSDVAELFIMSLHRERTFIMDTLFNDLKSGRNLIMNDEAEADFEAATHCHICNLPFEGCVMPQWKCSEDAKKVRDHDHLVTPEEGGTNYRGAAHSWCNLQFHIGFKLWDKEMPANLEEKLDEMDDSPSVENKSVCSTFRRAHQYKIPVVFHNLKGYDGHIVLRAIKSCNAENIFCIPQNGEKFLSFSFNNLKFVDSLQFLNSSLEKLVEVMKKDSGKDQFIYLNKYFRQICHRFKIVETDERMQLLLSKGTYPYDYMDSFDRFDETELPSKEAFKSILDDSDLSDGEYEHAKKVWEIFQIQNLGDYHDLYLITDVLLLTDVFQRFRSTALKDTGLEPLHYVSLPGFSLDACYFQCPPKLIPSPDNQSSRLAPFHVEVFDDTDQHKDMYLFCESAVRGGISMIPGRFGCANHKYLSTHDTTKPNKFIMYVDANNLYGWAMSQPMPVGEYSWVSDLLPFHDLNFLNNLNDEDDYGYLLEVDLHIPVALHDKFKCYPLAPESLPVKEEEVSSYTKDLRAKANVKHDKTPKLLCTLKDKFNYKLHYRNLKLYLSLGYVLKKVHRVLKFRQSRWINNYIASNTQKRAQATNEFSKDLFKLLNNAVFGKFLQDDRKHRKAEICNNPWKFEKHVSSPFYESRKVLNDETVVAYLRKDEIMLDKPIIVGVSILELSKLHMYNFYYNTLYRIYGSGLRLLMTDTDSLCVEIETDDFHHDIMNHGVQHLFDWSNYPKDHFMYDPKGKAVLGLFKDEFGGGWIKEFVGLRSKMYSVLKDTKSMTGEMVSSGLEKKVAKGVKKHIIKDKLRHEMYKECLLNPDYNPDNFREKMVGFKTYANLIHTTCVFKSTLSASDDKMYLKEDGISTLPYGHREIVCV